MILPGHLALGYLLTYFLIKFSGLSFSPVEVNFLLVLGTVFGAVIDLDFFSYFVKHRTLKLHNNKSHRDQMSHTPILWLAIGLLIYFYSTDTLTAMVGLVVWISVWGHLLFDTIEHGIMWLYPFSSKRYRFFMERELPHNGKEGLIEHYKVFFMDFYPTTKTFWIEIIVVIIFLIVYFF